MSDWRPISEWNRESEERRQRTIFPVAFVTDGSRVAVGEDWGDADDLDERGWRATENCDYDGPAPLAFAPTHFMAPPEPPVGD